MQRVSHKNTYHIPGGSNMRTGIGQIRRLKQNRAVAKSKPNWGHRFHVLGTWRLSTFCKLELPSFPAWLKFTPHSSNMNPLKAELSPLSITPLCVIPKNEKMSPVLSSCFLTPL